MSQSQPPAPVRSQSSTSLARLYQGANGTNGISGGEFDDPRNDFCNSFWGQGDRGYEVLMARLRGAARTTDELRAFWKERAAIEEEYAKKLAKLSKTTLGKDEIGDLAGSLQNILLETGQQATYHQNLGLEIRQSVEAPTAEFANRLINLKKGLQGSVEKSYKNKGLQEGHVNKARDRYESDCLKLNSYTANGSLVQGKDFEKNQQKLDRVRQTIGQNEQDFRQFVRVLEGTQQKWESEWKSFCDHVQDLEEDRLAAMKDIIWAFANAVSQVCVEDDASCERIREKLEQFEPQNDMLTFVQGWGTGDSIPDPPRFINYSAGEYPHGPATHTASFHRISSKPPMSANPPSHAGHDQVQPELNETHETNDARAFDSEPSSLPALGGLSLADPVPPSKSPELNNKQPFGGVALPGMAAQTPAPPPPITQGLPERRSSMPPPPVPPQITMPEPRIPSRQGPPTPSARDVNDDDDPMARALANLRREPPPPDSVRRNPSHRRADSVYSNQGSVRGGAAGVGGIKSPSSPGPAQFKSPPSPAPGNNRASYQQTQGQQRQSVDMGLSPPPGGHTAAALARSMDEFHKQSQRDTNPNNRNSVNYADFANDIVGSHPSRPSTPSGNANRAPSPAMMQPPRQPPSPVADEVLSQYHQAFPGERERAGRSRANSRANSINSRRSRATSVNHQQAPQSQSHHSHVQQAPPSPSAPRDGFAGIGAARGRSPSPQPPAFRSPSPSPVVHPGSLGPQNIGISLDEKGGVSHDSMAEAYRRQYQQSQQQQQQSQTGQTGQKSGFGVAADYSQPGAYGQGPKSPVGRPVSGYGAPQQQQGGQYGAGGQAGPGYAGQQPQQSLYQQQQGQPQQQQQSYYPSYTPVANPTQSPYQQQQQQPLSPVQQPAQQAYTNGYPQQQQQPPAQAQAPAGYGGYQQQQQQYPPQQQQPQQQQYGRSPSPAPQQPQLQHQQQPPQQQYGYRAPSPQPQYAQQQQQQQQPQRGRTPSPQPGQVPANAAPTGQWSTTGQPVLFYVKALYDYQAQSAAEFDFQAGDIIAVTSTPEDGWWSGELLDEARRGPGRTDFPSNFVCLF